jgi:RNA recognition motif-containing protein
MANKTLYVGNLPYSITVQQLTEHFQSYGSTNARIVEGRGFGFVDIDAAHCESAISEKNNTQLEGRTIVVNEARPKTEGGGERSGGYGSGSRSGGYSSGGGGGGRSRGNRW